MVGGGEAQSSRGGIVSAFTSTALTFCQDDQLQVMDCRGCTGDQARASTKPGRARSRGGLEISPQAWEPSFQARRELIWESCVQGLHFLTSAITASSFRNGSWRLRWFLKHLVQNLSQRVALDTCARRQRHANDPASRNVPGWSRGTGKWAVKPQTSWELLMGLVAPYSQLKSQRYI